MLVSWVVPVERKDIGVIRMVGGARDGDVFGLPDRATKALLWSTRAAVANFFARKSSTRLVIGSRASPPDKLSANCMSAQLCQLVREW